MSRKFVLKFGSLLVAIFAGLFSVFLTTLSGFNFFLYAATGGKEWPAYVLVFVVFLVVAFLVFKNLNTLLQQKFSGNQNKSAT